MPTKARTARAGEEMKALRGLLMQTGAGARLLARSGMLSEPTAGVAHGRVQANLCFVPERCADDFAAFLAANPVPCPMLDRSDAHPLGADGAFALRRLAPGDVASAFANTDATAYRVFRNGVAAADVHDVAAWAREHERDIPGEPFVAFAVGCSFTFESALVDAGLPIAHVLAKRNVPMYRTNVALTSVGLFGGNMVVSMRPFAPDEVPRVVEVSSRYPSQHGKPVHIGDPSAIGIADVAAPEFGDAPTAEVLDGIANGSLIPVFWGCGVSPQMALETAKLPLAASHAPGHMLIADVRCVDTCEAPTSAPASSTASTVSLLPPTASANLAPLAMERIVLHGDKRGMSEMHAHPRGLNGAPFLGEAADTLLGAVLRASSRDDAPCRIALLTGFFIPRAGAPETDGPPGVAALARGLARLPGLACVAVTDDRCAECVRATCDEGTEISVVPMDEAEARAAAARLASSCDVLVCVERVGPEADGVCRNMRGMAVNEYTAPTHVVVEAFASAGLPVLAVGDGGNELGMGRCSAAMPDAAPGVLPPGGGCVVSCDALVLSAASNYGCFGLLASLSCRLGQDLLPMPGEASADVERCVRAGGAVDGTTARAEATVDGRELSDSERCVSELRAVVTACSTC